MKGNLKKQVGFPTACFTYIAPVLFFPPLPCPAAYIADFLCTERVKACPDGTVPRTWVEEPPQEQEQVGAACLLINNNNSNFVDKGTQERRMKGGGGLRIMGKGAGAGGCCLCIDIGTWEGEGRKRGVRAMGNGSRSRWVLVWVRPCYGRRGEGKERGS